MLPAGAGGHQCCELTQRFQRAYKEYEGPLIAPPNIDGADIVDFPEKLVSSQVKYIGDLLTEPISKGDVDLEDLVILIANSANHADCLEHFHHAFHLHVELRCGFSANSPCEWFA